MHRRLLLAAWLGGACGPLQAQSDWRRVAVPAYTPPAFVEGALRHWYQPRAAEFAQAAARLAAALQSACGPAARAAWRDALRAWVRLGAVAVGPLVERRSARRIDFAPTRPGQIERAIARRPEGAAALEATGSAAKGLPALEWLLWRRTDAAACAYARQVAQDVAREAAALEAGFAALLAGPRDEAAVVATMSELVNQWIAGIEQLRLQGIERALQAGSRAARVSPGSAAAERVARWEALRALAVFEGTAAPAAGAGLAPLETYLRGQGLNPLADHLRGAALRAGRGLGESHPATLRRAAARLAALKHLVEAEVAPALDVHVGFSDADGD